MSAFRTWNGVDRWDIFPGVALHAIGGEPRREGKKVVFDEELSVNTVSSGGMRFEVTA
jgi:hypothetical protein